MVVASDLQIQEPSVSHDSRIAILDDDEDEEIQIYSNPAKYL